MLNRIFFFFFITFIIRQELLHIFRSSKFMATRPISIEDAENEVGIIIQLNLKPISFTISTFFL